MRKSLATDLQLRLDQINSGALDEGALATCLSDPRGLVRANALLALNKSGHLRAPTIDAIQKLAEDFQFGSVRVMGTVSQRDLALATLAWAQDPEAQSAYSNLLRKLSDEEARRVSDFVARGPIAT